MSLCDFSKGVKLYLTVNTTFEYISDFLSRNYYASSEVPSLMYVTSFSSNSQPLTLIHGLPPNSLLLREHTYVRLRNYVSHIHLALCHAFDLLCTAMFVCSLRASSFVVGKLKLSSRYVHDVPCRREGGGHMCTL